MSLYFLLEENKITFFSTGMLLLPGSALSVIFSAVRNLWLSKYFLAMDNDSQCLSRHSNPESGSPRNLVSGWSSWWSGWFPSLP